MENRKLYTEEELFYIVSSVAEKACAYSLEEEWIKEKIKDHGYTKFQLEVNEEMNNHIKELEDDDNIEFINIKLDSVTPYLEK